MPDRRRRTRVNFHARADIQATGARLLNLETRDLSHKGVFVLGELPLKETQGCSITLQLLGDMDNAPVLRMEGRVVRATSEGAAIDFVSMDPDTYLHLRNLVLLNAEDPEEAEKEFGQPAFEDPEA